ncbi:MAG: sugar phosphate isomerase [Methanobacteriota archaeon]
MQELMNFSEYPDDLTRFNHDWEEVRSFTRHEGLDGIELLIGSDTSAPNIPDGLVKTVHLPGWFGWTRTWKEPHTIPKDCDVSEIRYYYGTATSDGLLHSFRSNIERATDLKAAYGVLHVSHVELEEVYTRNFRYNSKEVLSAAASFVNTAFSPYRNGEPPVTLAFENLWWPGLTFRSEEEIEYFAGLLNFDNWMFVLDTGHLMNGLGVRSESEGIQKVLSALESLSEETVDRIRSIHMQCSLSEAYQQAYLRCSPPSSFSTMSYGEKMIELWRHIPHIDEHRPYSDGSCSEILDIVQPEYLVHEFITRSREELQEYIRKQKAVTGIIHEDIFREICPSFEGNQFYKS